jgi:phosphate transport system permease protein
MAPEQLSLARSTPNGLASIESSIRLITFLIAYELWANSALSRAKFGWSFLFTNTWDPIAGNFGALPFIYGTVTTTALGLLLAIPLGIGAAIFLAELAPPRISDGMAFLIELLAAVPALLLRFKIPCSIF